MPVGFLQVPDSKKAASKGVAKAVTMTNIIGADITASQDHLAAPDTHLHDYGKAKVREGRKMGHVTRLER